MIDRHARRTDVISNIHDKLTVSEKEEFSYQAKRWTFENKDQDNYDMVVEFEDSHQ